MSFSVLSDMKNDFEMSNTLLYEKFMKYHMFVDLAR